MVELVRIFLGYMAKRDPCQPPRHLRVKLHRNASQ
jgi:hypothetical protein